MNSFQWLLGNLLLIPFWTLVTNATYVDNTNATIQYQSSANNWFVSNLLYNYSQCYDGTAIYNLCATGDHCHITIPFTGSGIAIQIVQLGPRNNGPGLATNVSVTVDAQPPIIKTLYPIAYVQYNVTLYEVEGLAWGAHTLDIALVSMVYPGRTFSYATEMMFDYAIVNDSSPPPAPTSPTASSPTSPATPSTSPDTTANASLVSNGTTVNTGAIAGSVVGGFLGLLAITYLLFRRRRRQREEIDSEPKMDPFSPASHTYHEGSSPLPHSSAASSSFSSISHPHNIQTNVRDSQYSTADTKGSIRHFARSMTPTHSLHRLSTTLAAIRQDFTSPNAPASPTASNSTDPSVTPQSLKRGRVRANSSLWEASGPYDQPRPLSTMTAIEPTPIPAELSSSVKDLPDEQIEFVRGLVRVNVPIAEILRVVEVMKEDRAKDGTGSTHVGETTSMLDPAFRTLYHDF